MFSPAFPPLSNSSGRRSRITVFHWLNCTGCTEYSRAIWATVLTPRIASIPTFALKAALCFFRFDFVFIGLIIFVSIRPTKP